MNRLETKYLGLTLQSPIIVSSSPFTSTTEGIIAAQKAGAGAVVLKSIFEEQILAEIAAAQSPDYYPEAADYLNQYIADNNLAQHLSLIQKTKTELQIPIIASINCSTNGDWVKFAKVIETAGADAIELNIFLLPTSQDESSAEIEKQYLNIIAAVRDAISIPLSIKLPQNFTNPLNIVKEIYYRNVKGVTLFNRFYTPDINIETLTVTSANVWSNNSEIHNNIRWCGLIASQVPLVDISTSSGVHTPQDALKLMLAGAKTIQLCTAIHNNGLDIITKTNDFIQNWMRKHDFNSIPEFCGKLSYKNIPETNAYERTQFMKYFSSNKNY